MSKQSPNPKLVATRNVALVVGGFFFAKFSYQQLRFFTAIDPFQVYHEGKDPLDPKVQIQFDNVSMRHYRGMDLVAKTNADQVALWTDQQTVELTGVHDGVYRSKNASYSFGAKKAFYLATIKRLRVEDQAHVVSKDFDLTAKTLEFDGNQEVFDIKSGVKGKLRGGNVKAEYVRFNVKYGSYIATNIAYVGKLDFDPSLQDSSQDRTEWRISGSKMSKPSKSDVKTFTNGRATDGDVIVLADKIEHNEKTDIVTATGKVKYFSGKANLLADKVVIYRKEKRAVLTGNVQMLIKPKKDADLPPKEEEIPPFNPVVPDQVKAGRPEAPKPDIEAQKKQDEIIRSGKNAREYPMAISCAKIDYIYEKGRRKAIIEGNPQAHQELPENAWRHIWTKSAVYDGEAESLLLESSPGKMDTRMKNSIGDDFVTTMVTVSTKEEDDSMSTGEISGTLKQLDSDEIERDKKKKPIDPKRTPPPVISGKIGT